MTLVNDVALAIRIAARDMRGGGRALWLLVAGVFIGVAAVALVGAVSQGIADSARQGALETVGGDLSLRLFYRPPTDAELNIVRREGTVSITVELRPMVRAVRNGQMDDRSLLVELRGVDQAYPLYGTVETLPRSGLRGMLEQRGGIYGAVADPSLFSAMELKPGDRIQVGEVRYQLRGSLVSEPDRVFRAFTLGPRLMVSRDSLAASGGIDTGATAYFYSLVKMAPGPAQRARATAALARIDRALPETGWRMVNAHAGVPGVERTMAMAHALLLFIGLGVMLVGGAGIVAAVRSHIAQKTGIIAVLKSLGASARVITLAIGMEVMLATSVGAIAGVGLGAFGPALAASALAGQLPFSLEVMPSLKPLVVAAMFGILVASLFAWWPLAGVREVSVGMLLHKRVTQDRKRMGAGGWIGSGLLLLALGILVFQVSPLPVLTAGFLAGALVLTVFYRALGLGVVHMACILARGRGVSLRLALANLHRPGTPTGLVVMALGLTLTLLVALDGISAAAQRHLQDTLPQKASDLVAFSLRPDVARRLEADLAGSGIVAQQRFAPFLHARLQAIGGVPVQDLEIPASVNWVIRGDRGVSFASSRPDGSDWPKARSGWPGFSVDTEVAEKLGLKSGDMITLNLSGDVRSGEVLGFHEVNWSGLDLDFPFVATPDTFSGIPYTLAASLKASPGKQQGMEAYIKKRFPDVPLIRVADVLRSLARSLSTIVAGLETAALMCGLAALVVLSGSVLQGLRKRTSEAVLFKVLGARRRQLLGMVAVEFLALGVLTALVAVPLGMVVAFAVARAAGLGSVEMSWSGGVTLAGVAIFTTLATGLAVTLGAYSVRPAQALRNRQVP